MKFGKRLLAEAARNWAPQYLDYKLIKQCLKSDCRNKDPTGSSFTQAMQQELSKVDIFYIEREMRLKATMAQLENMPLAEVSDRLAQLRFDVQELTKFAVLNYIAVMKAVKKRNRRIKETCGADVSAIEPFDILQHQSFFASKVLSQVATSAAILEEKLHPRRPKAEVAREYECPICLELLHAPVVLTCSHRFCWGCITTHCAGILQLRNPGHGNSDVPKAPQPLSSTPPRLQPVDVAELHPGWQSLVLESDLNDRNCAFDCPMCRKKQILDVDHLSIDQNLNAFVEQLRARRASGTESADFVEIHSAASCIAAQDAAPAGTPAAIAAPAAVAKPTPAELPPSDVLLPPREPQWRGKLTIALDLDGTLIASFPPRRAPRLPKNMRTHLVGQGSKLNPQGVFVVERPGLQAFLRQVLEIGEPVIFTAGLKDYAQPIIAAIDPDGAVFGDRIVYRDGTTASPEYPCVKDLSRLGRPVAQTLLVDDTPLAFLWQPDNGVPVMGFRGDPDDNLLLDAVLPLLQTTGPMADVRPFLDNRFGMASWFESHGYLAHKPAPAGAAAATERSDQPAAASTEAQASVAAAVALRSDAAPRHNVLLLCDFDKTLVDFDAGERITEVLAPELGPMLASLESPANFVPVTNAVLSEMRNRGVCRERLLTELQALGKEMPSAVCDMLRAARRAGATMRVLSDCNTVFISNILKGAGCEDCVHDVITNGATFVRASSDAQRDMVAAQSSAGPSVQHLPSHKLVVSPCQPEALPHSCSLCPASLCKGMYTKALLPYHPRILFVGDGANDLCAVLCMREKDVAFVRAQHACHVLLVQRAALGGQVQQPVCQIAYWSRHEELSKLVQQALAA